MIGTAADPGVMVLAFRDLFTQVPDALPAPSHPIVLPGPLDGSLSPAPPQARDAPPPTLLVLPRAIAPSPQSTVPAQATAHADTHRVNHRILVSFLEIYNENIFDLLVGPFDLAHHTLTSLTPPPAPCLLSTDRCWLRVSVPRQRRQSAGAPTDTELCAGGFDFAQAPLRSHSPSL